MNDEAPTINGDGMQSRDFTYIESVVRLAVSVGGDSDTIAAIAGSIAGAFYGVPKDVEEIVLSRLDDRLLDVVERFNLRFGF